MKNKKQQAVEKLTSFLDRFKKEAIYNPNSKDWTPETLTLIKELNLQWNTYCYNTQLHYMHRLFIVETYVAKDVIQELREEGPSRLHWHKKLREEDAIKYKDYADKFQIKANDTLKN